jgi:hypothetical protein
LSIVPVIVLDYSPQSFQPVALLQDMKAVRNMQINECIWQLGDNSFHAKDRISGQKYSDDLKTLKILCDSANKEHSLKWSVAADSTLLTVPAEKLNFDVVAYESER